MKGFLVGFATASALFGAVFFLTRRPSAPVALPVAKSPDGGVPARDHRRHRQGSGATAAAELRPADLRPASEGDELSRPDVIDMGAGGPSGELDQEEVDARFRAHQAEILACIDKARPSPDAAVVGKVIVRFRLQRAGTVRGVRVEAPSVLLRGGLYRCVRPVVLQLHFPASGQSLLLAYPFQLD